MKTKTMVTAIALFCAMAAEPLVTMAQSAPPPPPPPGMSVGANAPDGSGAPQQRRRRRKMLTPEQQMEKFGGFVEPAYSGKFLYFMDLQGRIPASAVEWVTEQVRIALSLPTRIERKATGTQIPTTLSPDAGGMISVVDIDGEPSLLVAPDNGWARVNVAALAVDGAAAEVLEARVKKELWRAFVILFGGGNSLNDFDVMRPIRTLKDLDACKTLVSSPEPFNAMLNGAKAAGITPVRRTTYLNAVRLGWAPPPTNEYQKAMWERVKADKERGPTNPITIQPPNAKK